MKGTRMSNRTGKEAGQSNEQMIEVLYQKMGDRWFAFSLIEDEVFVGSIHPSELEESQIKFIKPKKSVGHS